MTDSERGTPTAASVPATPDTPGGPLFSSVRIDSLERESFAMGRCNMCIPGGKSNSCINLASGVGIPSVSLAQKVTTSLSLFVFLVNDFFCDFFKLFFVITTAHKLISFDF
jgi:hypothetical protein